MAYKYMKWGRAMVILKWLDKNIEEFLMVIFLALMTCVMGVQIGMRYIFNNSLVWSEELTGIYSFGLLF